MENLKLIKENLGQSLVLIFFLNVVTYLSGNVANKPRLLALYNFVVETKRAEKLFSLLDYNLISYYYKYRKTVLIFVFFNNIFNNL